MSQRLSHLQRQQALLREHLAWIESEIARETPAGSSPSHSPAPTLAPTTAFTPPPATSTQADALLEKYAAAERQNPADIRRGCFIVFGAALALLTAGVAALWVLFYQ